MAETVARRGGLTVIPQDIPIDVVADVVAWVKSRHLVFDTPITLDPAPDRRRRAGAAARSARTARRRGRGRPARSASSPRTTAPGRPVHPGRARSCPRDLVTLAATRRPARGLRHARRGPPPARPGRRRRRPAGRASSPAPARCAPRSTRPAVDADGRLRIAAAVGINGDVAGKADDLLDAGVDCLVVDTAHGHQEQDDRGAAARSARSTRRCRSSAGNVVSAEGVRDLIEAGADIVKVGVGPGAMCTTRMMTGVGPPAVLRRARVRRRPPASSASTSGPTAACATRATSRSRWPPARPT